MQLQAPDGRTLSPKRQTGSIHCGFMPVSIFCGTDDVEYLGAHEHSIKLICLHGGPGVSHKSFLPWLEPLSKNMQIVLYTQGFHQDYSIEGLTNELADIVQSFGSNDRIFILAHSFGAVIALEYIRRFSERRLSGLILSNWVFDSSWIRFGIPFKQNLPAFDADVCKDIADEIRMSTKHYAELYFAPSHAKAGRAYIEGLEYNIELIRGLQPFLRSYNCAAVVRHLTLPVLSIAGTADRMVPLSYIKSGTSLNDQIICCEIPGAGHLPFFEDRVLFNSIVRSFVEESCGELQTPKVRKGKRRKKR